MRSIMIFDSVRLCSTLGRIGVSLVRSAYTVLFTLTEPNTADMEQMIYLRWNYRKGFRGWTHSDVSKRAYSLTYSLGTLSSLTG